ncbi:helix-turn-helix transcriptional regulator [Acetobacterium carbinolicum]|uniref:helix-turn-helix transcriptional regulator n=1 Tax=Acetobacterium carbinolicum TaxID=52690 RepID=UPI0039BED79E
MHFFSSDNEMNLTETEATIISDYKNLTGFDCVVFELNEDLQIQCTMKKDHTCNYVCNTVMGREKALQGILRFRNLVDGTYIFDCQGVFFFWATLIELEDERNLLFIGGPAIITEIIKPSQMSNLIDEIRINVEESEFSIYPRATMKSISYASRLMHDLLQLKYSLRTSKRQQNSVSLKSIKRNYDDIERVFEDNNRTEIAHQLKLFDNCIDGIIQCALIGDYTNANTHFFNLIEPGFEIDDHEYTISFIIGMISLMGQTIAESIYFKYTDKLFSFYTKFLNDIVKKNDKINIKALSESYFHSFFTELTTCYFIHMDKSPHVRRIIEYVKENYYRIDISLSTMSTELSLDSSYLCRVFKKETGITIMNFVKSYRLMIAADKLRNTTDKIETIANSVGFLSTPLFRSLFKEHFNASPKEYRINF